MALFQLIISDLRRYHHGGRFEWFEPSIPVIVLYRLSHAARCLRFAPLRGVLLFCITPFYMFFSLISGIHIARQAVIGPGLRIFHFGCIVIHSGTRMGENCTLRHGVTLGNRHTDSDAPTLGNHVDVGAGAKVLGCISVGNHVSVGANAVVLTDVPDYAVAVGVPARVILRK